MRKKWGTKEHFKERDQPERSLGGKREQKHLKNVKSLSKLKPECQRVSNRWRGRSGEGGRRQRRQGLVSHADKFSLYPKSNGGCLRNFNQQSDASCD